MYIFLVNGIEKGYQNPVVSLIEEKPMKRIKTNEKI
jgi:hypothetical protein